MQAPSHACPMMVLASMENLLLKCFADEVLVAEVLVYGRIFVRVGHVLIKCRSMEELLVSC